MNGFKDLGSNFNIHVLAPPLMVAGELGKLSERFAGEMATIQSLGIVGMEVEFAMIALSKVLTQSGRVGRILAGGRILSGLPDHLAGTFAGGRFTSRVLKDDLVLFRIGESGKPLGQFFSKDMPISAIQSRIDKAIFPAWPGGAKSVLDTVFKIKIPSGTTVHTGRIGSQGGRFVGGTQQIVVEKPWLIKGVKVLPETSL